ncbi:ATP-dependent RNA helicase DbpA [Hydrogenimonas cancrithermarum]|uniref:ATP-dependent RNA helicase n=1 Tax=Hydrogenimonas cancrithermarum TaxID=2993563 RepID=A0ABM8FHT9_9BACT|nr:ATP-dependent RNA helicase DbpA [Hydrogenimonas cancrithermarum]BDY11848.1 ATP-dependent RNA helicase [Hydrogenimonas cancrithermarum]
MQSNLSFSTLPLSKEILKNLASLGYSSMTQIQARSLPHILKNRDVIAKAKTGSGKTAAFGIGLLDKLDVKAFRIQEIVLCPTRELADQVAKELRRLARFTHNVKILTLCGGMPFGPQRRSLEHGAHIIVGTPGRIQDHLGKGTLLLDNVHTLVLDEADRMLDMGFHDAILKIVSNIPKLRQTLLFSATFPKNIEAMSKKVQNDAVTVIPDEAAYENKIAQYSVRTRREDKTECVLHLLSDYRPKSAMLFCNTKLDVQEVARTLQNGGIHAKALHGDLEQLERTEVLVQFSNGSTPVLVATDVAARGLDIANLDMVINYDLPHDPEVYLHRIGRTGRAGNEGMAISLRAPYDEKKLKTIEGYQKKTLEEIAMPERETKKEPLPLPQMQTLCIFGGKKEKLRPGDILGALAKDAGIEGRNIGKIDIFDVYSYVAVVRSEIERAVKHFENGKIKGRAFKTKVCD